MKLFVVAHAVLLFLFVNFGTSSPQAYNFEMFVREYDKKYGDDLMELIREVIFEANMEKIDAHNSNPNATFTMAPNRFADMTAQEFQATLTLKPAPLSGNLFVAAAGSEPALTFDWRTKGVVTPVKDQGNCGSCWAFSTTGALEGLYAIKSGKLLSFSEQELVDCDTVNSGCEGGLMDQAFKWIIDSNKGGLASEADYPYTAVGGTCKKDSINNAATILTGYSNVSPHIQDLKAAVSMQPVAVAVDASSWQFYSGGVMKTCKKGGLNHGVLLVGYDSASWIVKNSWGTGWGEQGYIRIQIAEDSTQVMCGITAMASYTIA